MKDKRDTVESGIHRTAKPEDRSAIERAKAHGIDITQLQAVLRYTPTERLEMLRARTSQGESAIERAAAYGIDISLLKLALTWTPTQRVQKTVELATLVRTLHNAGAKKHGPRAYPQATDEPRG